MAVEIKVPELPESVEEGTLAQWNKQNGDTVERDEVIAEVETDKIVLEVFALQSGVLETLKEEGDTLQRGDTLARISGDGAKAAPAKAASAKSAPAKSAPAGDASKPAADATKSKAAPADSGEKAAPDSTKAAASLSPSVRQLVNEHNLDATQITGTGKDGRILKSDVETFIKSGAGATASEAKAPEAKSSAPVFSSPPKGDQPERRVPMSRIRKRIAERLVEVQHTAAILTTFNEVNMKPVMDIRARYKEKFLEEYGTKLGFMSFFVKATTEALKKFPVINASLDGDDVVYHEYYNIGIAVDSPRGLVVPVVPNANTLSFAEIERTIRSLAQKAKDASLKYDDLVGGTFTITNGGTFGSMLSTPILNAPQSAILGMHNIIERPMAIDGEVKIRPVMYLALSYDHRIIDGRDAVQFLVSIKESLEEPEKLLLQL